MKFGRSAPFVFMANFVENSQEKMKKIYLLGLLAVAACQSNSSSESSDQNNGSKYPQFEQTELELNGNVVYGVVIRDSSASEESRSYQVTFKLQDKVWYDTIIMDLPGSSVVQGESIFTEAVVNDMGGAQFEVTEIDLK